jgi:hypothetical protein
VQNKAGNMHSWCSVRKAAADHRAETVSNIIQERSDVDRELFKLTKTWQGAIAKAIAEVKALIMSAITDSHTKTMAAVEMDAIDVDKSGTVTWREFIDVVETGVVADKKKEAKDDGEDSDVFDGVEANLTLEKNKLGFKDAEDYYEQNSSFYFLEKIRIPVLIVNAQNDPFLTEECIPFKLAESLDFVYLEAPKYGGHCGFYPKNYQGITWSEKRAAEWFKN